MKKPKVPPLHGDFIQINISYREGNVGKGKGVIDKTKVYRSWFGIGIIKISAKNYSSITGAPSATTTRDLTKMVEIGAFKKTGALKSTRYHLNIKMA